MYLKNYMGISKSINKNNFKDSTMASIDFVRCIPE